MQLSSALKALAVTVALAAPLGVAARADAAPLNGTAAIGSAGANETGMDLLSRTAFTISGAFVGNTSGDFNGTPTLASPRVANPTALTIGAFDVSDPASFSVHSTMDGRFGTFTAGSFMQVTRRADFLDGLFTGVFTPDKPGVVDAFDGGPATFRIGLTRSVADGHASVSFSGTLALVPGAAHTDVPEPASMALLGVGLLGLGLTRRGLTSRRAG